VVHACQSSYTQSIKKRITIQARTSIFGKTAKAKNFWGHGSSVGAPDKKQKVLSSNTSMAKREKKEKEERGRERGREGRRKEGEKERTERERKKEKGNARRTGLDMCSE
jgi:hypothetical protein